MILVIDDDDVVREALVSALEEAGYQTRSHPGVDGAVALIEAIAPTLVLLDVRLRDGDGLDLLAVLRERFRALPVIVATAYGDSDRAIRAMQLGAFDYLTKPFDWDQLFDAVGRGARPVAPARAQEPPPEAGRVGSFVGKSPAMLGVWKRIGRAAAGDLPVLITGESGVGKELVARAIHEHRQAGRAAAGDRQGNFLAVNVAALPEGLLESELFGHERGAFTGASSRRVGRFELAADGTLFLDEIGDLPLALQTKLLRVLDDGIFERVGDTVPIASRARIVAATSRAIVPGAAGATLREDLFYRLSVLRIDVPPLRQRIQDVPLLAHTFLDRACGKGGRRAISDAALDHLLAYPWPGNVRELRHAVESALAMSSAEVLDVDDFQLGSNAPSDGEGAEDALAPSVDLDLRRHLDVLERALIVRALESAEGNRARAARLLGIRRAYLYVRLRHHGLGDPPADA